ncbi:RND family efflux transporter MFP subunit [Undibacterium sp. GrIS 1.2]|uniref:efflux RND transporter periplasmic adaptor subunit n=1 Tax=Undibacterium sp. GrIS 1.2 TaxID=3143933 RepID=UPI003398DA14
MSKLKTIVAVLVVAGLAAGGYYKWSAAKTDAGDKASKAGADNNRPISVSTTLAIKRDYPVQLSANGVVTALSTVDIRPQITSTVTKVHIKEGQFVKAGDLLFTLDSRADEVNLAKAQAQLDKDLATQADNQRQLARSKDLLDKKFVSQSVVDTSQTQVDAQAAVIASDRAAVNAAIVALTYDRIVAPAAGRTGVISVYPGSLVQATTTVPALVTITQMDPITISFPLPQRNLQDALDAMNQKDDQKNPNAVTAQLPDHPEKYRGRLQFVDNVVDALSGTIKAKAVLDNRDLKLWPGAYADIGLSVRTMKDAIVIPIDAVINNAQGSAVYVVDVDNKVSLRPVKVVYSAALDAVVTGIEVGAKVVLDGKQNLRPGNLIRERVADSKTTNPKMDTKSDTKPETKSETKLDAKSEKSASQAASAS